MKHAIALAAMLFLAAACGGEPAAVGAEVDGPDGTLLSGEGSSDGQAGADIPHSHGAVVAARGKAVPVVGSRDDLDGAVVPAECPERFSGVEVPQT